MKTHRMPTEGTIKLDPSFQWTESPDCMYLIDAGTQRTIAVNHPLWQSLGYKLHEVEVPHAAVPQQFLHKNDHILVDDFFAHLRSMDAHGEYRRHLRFVSKTGAWKTFCLRIVPYDIGQKHFLGVITNISPEKGSYQRARRRIASLSLAHQKLDTLIMELCHDIRTPLQTIHILASKLGSGGHVRASEAAVVIEHLKKTAAQINATLNGVLSRRMQRDTFFPDAGPPANVRSILSQVEMEASVRLKGTNREIITDVASNVPDSLCLSGPELYQVLMNLVINAIKHNDQGPVSLGCHWMPDTNELRISVRDTGRAQQTNSEDRSNGFGLGLGICQRLLKDIGGRMSVTSADGGGTEAIVTLPAYDPDAAEPFSVVADTKTEAGNFKILALDGDPFTLSLLSMFASSLGGQCIARDNIYDAMDLHIKPGERFDAILIDQRLAEAEDYRALQRLRRYDPESRLFIMHETDGAAMGGIVGGAISCEGWLRKPLSVRDLRAIVCEPADAGNATEDARGVAMSA